jgi:putative membrane protein
MLMRLHTACVLAFVLSTAAGCGKSTPEPEAPLVADPPPPPPMEEPMTMAPPPTPAETAATPPPPPAEKPLTDGQIAKIVITANTGEIEQAKLALTKAKSPRVKKFAQTMIQHHGESNKNAEKLLAKSGMAQEDVEIAQKLQADSQALVDSWKDLKGAEFDAAYMAAQVKEHQDVLAMFDAKLIPQAKNEELKKELTSFRPKIEMHLKDAEDIQSKLAPASGAPGATPGTGAPGSKPGTGTPGSTPPGSGAPGTSTPGTSTPTNPSSSKTPATGGASAKK